MPTVFTEHRQMLLAVKKDGWALKDASAKLQGDREIVMEAVKENGRALQFASAALQGDPEIVMQAAAKIGYELGRATDRSRIVRLKGHVDHLINHSFNAPKYTFMRTLLLGAFYPKNSNHLEKLPNGMLREIAEFAGMPSGEKRESIAAAEKNLNKSTP